MNAKFEVKMTQKILYHFLVTHTYHSLSGLLSVALGVCAFVLGVFRFRGGYASIGIALFVFAAYVLLIMPVMLYFNAAKQIKSNPAFQHPILYEVDETGVSSIVGEEEAKVPWENVLKVRETKYALLLYTGKRYCSILSKEGMGSREETVKKLMQAHLKPEQVKIRV